MTDTIIKIEEGYHEGIKELVKDYLKQIEEKIVTHSKISSKFYVKHVCYSIPQVILPVIMIFVSQISMEDEKHKLVNGVGFLITGLLSGINSFFKFNSLSEKHDRAGNEYNTLKDYIYSNIARSDNYKIQADVFMEHIKTTINSLSKYSPSTTNVCISDCCKNH